MERVAVRAKKDGIRRFLMPAPSLKMGVKSYPDFAIDVQEHVRALMELKPAIFFRALFFEWFVIAACIGLWLWSKNLYVLPLLVLIIGSRQSALTVLTHEAVHGHIMKNKRWNNRIGKWFCAWPLGFSFESYKYAHMSHHSRLATNEDIENLGFRPTLARKKTVLGHIIFFAKSLVGLDTINMFKYVFHLDKSNPKHKHFNGEKIIFVLFFGLLCFGFASANWFPFMSFFLLWILPSLTVRHALTLYRIMSEHPFDVANPDAPDFNDIMKNTRSIKSNYLEKMLIAPYNINRHREHHLYEKIPFYNLNKLSDLLAEKADFRADAHEYESYFGLLNTPFSEVILNPEESEGVWAIKNA